MYKCSKHMLIKLNRIYNNIKTQHPDMRNKKDTCRIIKNGFSD